MKVLLDECLPKKLKNEITGYEVKAVPEMGWAGKKNGELLKLAETEFQVFITADQNLKYQQNLSAVGNIAIIVLIANNNRFDTLKLLIPSVLTILNTITSGSVINIDK